ncbi:MAG: hypothetical protein FJX74_07850 [Armatimonadetes bacterium]|nr:hypothetical protein [Armatimonadota bacterium]
MARCSRLVSRRKGSTLIEAFLAAVIVSIGFIGVAGAMSYATKVSRLARDTVTAENLAAGLLAQARFRGLGELSSWYTYPGETSTTGLEHDFNALLSQSELPKAQAWLTVTDVPPNLKGVTVIIEWGTGNPRGRVATETLISPRF